MKIVSTDLALQSDHAASTRQERRETLRAWRGARPDFERQEATGKLDSGQLGSGNLDSVISRISTAARAALAAAAARPSAPSAVPPAPTFSPTGSGAGQISAASAIEAADEAVDNDPFLLLVKRMVEFMTGQEVRTLDVGAFSARTSHVEASAAAVSAQTQSATAEGGAGYGVEYDYHAVYEEIEATSFSAQGVVRTADGQEIGFQLDLAMTRQYREETHVSVRAGDAVRKDPLVVNFDGTAAQLAAQSGQRFTFDLDGNGRAESLPLFASGSGYLALDLNGNGRIDSGKELFGPQSGNGFTDLARLDSDDNGWIDENDADFRRLSVWTPAAEGNGRQQALADLGIGALALAHAATPFALRGDGNSDLGVVRSSGVFLFESGKAGSLQEIDLTV